MVDAVRKYTYDRLPTETLEVARHCLLDFFGVALAGSSELLVNILVETVAQSENADEAGLIGRPERASRLTAALINGAAAHALDYDDTHTAMSGHPTVPIMPALLALCEVNNADRKSLLESFVAGVELECRLGTLLGEAHYGIGFHSTATAGTFGAAAACAHFLGLNEDQWLAAMGLAGTQAAGLKASFGTMAKPLHAGKAATTGLLSALLANQGFSASADILEVPQGFFATHAGRDSSDVIRKYEGRFLICDTLFKYHASCYLTHAPIDAARSIQDAEPIEPRAIESVDVHVSPVLLDVCNIESPETGLEGKFSLRATTALALLGRDTADLSTFTDAVMAEPELVAMRDRVRVVPTEGLTSMQARLTVHTKDGAIDRESDSGIPSRDLSAQRDRLLAKFMALAGPVLGRSSAESLADSILSDGETGTVEGLMELVRPAETSGVGTS